MPKRTITLPPIHEADTASLTIECDRRLAQALERYRLYYKEQYAAEVAPEDLLCEMARCFMESDAGFQRFGRKRRRSPRPPKSIPASTGSEQRGQCGGNA